MIAITKVNLPYGWMSNMSNHKIEWDGNTFSSSEQLFMYLRIKPKYANIRGKLLSISKPMAAKIYIKLEIEKNPEILVHKLQSQDDIDLMKFVVGLKLEQYPELVNELINTKDHIYEDVTKRISAVSSALFWGHAEINRDNPNIESFMVGQNMLGEIYMEYRNFYKNQ